MPNIVTEAQGTLIPAATLLGYVAENAATNTVLQSQTFDNATWSKSNATAPNDATTPAPDGTLTADRFTDDATPGNHYAQQGSIAYTAAPYTASLYVKAGTLPWIQISMYDGAHHWANFNLATGAVGNKFAGVTTSVQTLPNGWFRISITNTMAATAGGFCSIFASLTDVVGTPAYVGSGQTMFLWGAQVEPGTSASGYNPTTTAAVPAGNIVTEAQGTLIPTATMLGYVAENAATNLCLQSQTFDNAAWTKSNATITANTQTAPDGTLTADTWTDDATNAAHQAYQQMVIPAAAHTFSAYVKKGTLPWMQLTHSSATPTAWANFNLTTGAVGFVGAGTTARSEALPNGWFRISISFTGNGTNQFAQFFGLPSDINANAPSYVGTGQTMYLWGAQVEASSDPSSYIPTTTAAVVRAVDNLQYQSASNLNLPLATTYAECYLPVAAVGAQQMLLWMASSTFSPQYYPVSKRLEMYAGGNLPSTVNLRATGAVNKGASAWGGTTASICLNGGAVATATIPIPAVDGAINFGTQNAATALQGTMRNVKFYSTRLTDVELQGLTA